MPEVIRYVRQDGEQAVVIWLRDDGLYTFWEEVRFWEEAHPATGDGFFHWQETGEGISLFDSRERTQQEVKACYPWVRDVPLN